MKKIFLLTTLLFQLTFVFGQICVESETMYNSGGLNVSYCTTSQGNEGNCSKYTVSISIRNNGSDKISIAGSSIFIGGNCKETSYSNSYGEIRFAFPAGGLGFVTELSPNYNMTKSYVAYTNNNKPPVVKWYITPNYMSVKKETTKPQNTNTTSSNQNTESQTYQNIQEAITKFNSLINQAANADQQVATRIQTDVQNALKSDRNTESFKLTMVNNGIRDLENLIARKSNNSINQTNTSTQQNDLTEYNRSKADLERQMNEKNAEGEQKSQNYTTAMNAGISAHNSGNYAEAKNQFSIALNNCNTEESRAKAQEYYNKSIDGEKKNRYNNNLNEASTNLQNKDYNGAIQSFGNAMNSATNKAEKRNATIGVASSGVAGVFDILAKAKEEKRKEQENERIKQEQKEYKLKQENDIMEANWINAQNLADIEDYTQAIKIMLPYANANKLNGMALNTIGFWYWKLNDYTNALKWYKKSAEKKDANAMRNMGVLYENGNGVERNLNIALQWYKDACKNGNSQACENHLRVTTIADEEAKQRKTKIENADVAIGNVAPFFKNGKFGFENTTTKEIKIPEKYSEVGVFSNGLALAKLDDKFGYIDKLGNVAIPFIYTNAFNFIDGVAVVATNTRIVNNNKYSCNYEVIDMTGKTIANYFLIYDFKEGLARARNNDNKWGFIDKNGKVVLPFNLSDVDDFSEGLAKVRTWNGKDFKYGFIDKTGTQIILSQYDFMTKDFSDGMAKVEINDKYGFIDKTGKLIVSAKYTNSFPDGFTEGLAAVEKSKKYGFVDKNGAEVIPLKYQGAGGFSEGLAYVKLNNKFGFIDKNGTEVIPLIYEGCWPFKDGLASVLLDGKWGCIDNTGKVIIPIKYNSPSQLQFKNGFATIELNGKLGRLDKNGNEYW